LNLFNKNYFLTEDQENSEECEEVEMEGEELEVGVDEMEGEVQEGLVEDEEEEEHEQENFEEDTILNEFVHASRSLLTCMYQDNRSDCLRRVHNVRESENDKKYNYNCLR